MIAFQDLHGFLAKPIKNGPVNECAIFPVYLEDRPLGKEELKMLFELLFGKVCHKP